MASLRDEIKQVLQEVLSEEFNIKGEPVIEISPKQEFGDFASNISSLFPREESISFDEFMNSIVNGLKKKVDIFTEVIRKGSYVNLFLQDSSLFGQLKKVIADREKYGMSKIGKGKKILVEFVSTNPTGPLNIVNARAAVVGDVLVKVLNFSGYKADAEFYINDGGRQIDMLGISAEKRFEELQGKKVEIPEDGYRGEYIKECISKFLDDAKVNSMQADMRVNFLKNYVKDEMIEWQKKSLERFGVIFEEWVSETEILKEFSTEQVVDHLKERGDVYEEDGALWFATKKYGDDKDRVLIKGDGTHTYIVSDASYHKNKFERGYEHLINLWGPDHHGDIMRLKAAVEAFGFHPENLEIIIIQQVSLLSRGKKEKMSKRAGRFITLDSLLDSVDKDAIRFFFLMRRTQAHLDFDIELAKTLSLENPVYYTQYCHARAAHIMNFAVEKGINPEDEPDISLLTEPQERALAKLVLVFPEVVLHAAERREVHKIPYYLLDLSKAFHSYYQKTRIVIDDKHVSLARLLLVQAVKQVINNGLDLIGVNAPEKM